MDLPLTPPSSQRCILLLMDFPPGRPYLLSISITLTNLPRHRHRRPLGREFVDLFIMLRTILGITRESAKGHIVLATPFKYERTGIILPSSKGIVSSNESLVQMKRSIPGCDGNVNLAIIGMLHTICPKRGHDPAEAAPKNYSFYFVLYILTHFEPQGRHVVKFGTTHFP